ncbi:hypothetical protein KIPB_005143 [Kipferlia bialata]|uniref:Uncharacterized protein n=1 Tax=Kipferlia bialata TaxID=797122 RepID=A0A9K3GIB2_9EUKA|nr:hypothetical protein KIPB_005143 [Kipferlia bialata]|eukprot:g5143.t1
MPTDDDALQRARAAVDTCLAERYPGVEHHEALEAQAEFYLLQGTYVALYVDSEGVVSAQPCRIPRVHAHLEREGEREGEGEGEEGEVSYEAELDQRHIEYLARCRALPPLLKGVQSSDITECHPSLPLPSASLFVRAVPLTRESILCPVIRGIFLDPLFMDARLSALMKFSERYKRGFLQSHRSDGKRTLLQELAHRLPRGGISLPDGSIVKGVSLYLDCSCSGTDHVDTIVSSIVRGGVYEALREWCIARMSVGDGLDNDEKNRISQFLYGVSEIATRLGIPHTLPEPSLVSMETDPTPLHYNGLVNEVDMYFRNYSGPERSYSWSVQAPTAVPKPPRLPILYVLLVDAGSLLMPNHRKESPSD